MIVKIKDFLDKDQIKDLNTIKDTLTMVDGKDTAGTFNENHKSSKVFGVGNEIYPIMSIIDSANNIPSKLKNNVTMGPYDWSAIRIAEYNKGDFYGWHMDEPLLYKGKDIIRTTKISFTIWLNDDYEGGELEIETESGTETIKPNIGDAVFYPSNLLHRVNEITNGTRRVVIGWLDCFIPNANDRFMMKEINDSILQLMVIYENIKNKEYDEINLESFFKLVNKFVKVKCDMKRRMLGQ